ncbi:hypothetical protein A1O7_02706 [Cladophialophora yegresii CBS 114405]|uniref:Transcription factor domain-containing protein n=1 Tax=Cladophialophora yegresii CBS 114405 TaxID=1182544 RepID=W9W2S3_9EURO|nr:uncharacterized protein A1O7_02706 [Cladophialophora yegresii CBS 114405]EXJ62273.1 hypothetical protein A1O7_02706 [Cladophialophora yegresii CBS 114405]
MKDCEARPATHWPKYEELNQFAWRVIFPGLICCGTRAPILFSCTALNASSMVLEQPAKLTFLSWSGKGKKKQSEERLQSLLRHQHTALAGHRRQREHKRAQRDKADPQASVAPSNSPGQLSDLGTDASLSLTWSATPATSNHLSYDFERFPSPVTVLGTNLFDSVHTNGDVKLSKEFQSVLHDALLHQWPAFALGTNEHAIVEVRRAAFSTSALSPHTLFAIIYAGACYRSYFRNAVPGDNLLQLQAKQQALACLREAVQQGKPTDEMLMTIALLAIHGSVQPLKRPRFTAPLYRDNEFYSNVKFDQTHLRALRTLVGQRGGLHELEIHGLSNIISMIDTFQSLMCLSRPRFESLYPAPALSETLQETWDDVTWTRFANQEDGFQFLDTYDDGFQLRRIICQTRILLETYSLFLRNPRQAPDLMLAVHTRRSLQHAALMLERRAECLFEAARVATIIFLAELGWTLPVVGGFQDTATALLLRALKECRLQQCWQTHPDFLVWATVIGGLAAHQSPRLRDFAELLREASMPVSKDSWLHVKSLSLKFLPFEYELTATCHAFWDEACDPLSSELVT